MENIEVSKEQKEEALKVGLTKKYILDNWRVLTLRRYNNGRYHNIQICCNVRTAPYRVGGGYYNNWRYINRVATVTSNHTLIESKFLINNALSQVGDNEPVVFAAFANKKIHHFIMWKEATKLFVNGHRILKMNMGNLFLAWLSMHPRWENEEDSDNYITNYIRMDPIVKKALTDKVLYTFYNDKGNKVESLISIQPISEKEIAIELNPGTWVPMTVGALKSFYYASSRKNRFTHISPEELYYVCTKKFMSEAERKMTHAFLEQNRKSALREKRSMELMEDLSTRFEGRIFAYEVGNSTNGGQTMTDNDRNNNTQGMFINGKENQWAVITRALKATGRQDVSTYCLFPIHDELTSETREDDEYERYYLEYRGTRGQTLSAMVRDGEYGGNGYSILTGKRDGKDVYFVAEGPICIDNQESDVSLGDQLAGRALALLNDVHSKQNISTLGGYRGAVSGGDVSGLSDVRFLDNKERFELLKMRCV